MKLRYVKCSGMCYCVFFLKQKAPYEKRISYWSSDVCSSDLTAGPDESCGGQRIDADHHARAKRKTIADTIRLMHDLAAQLERRGTRSEERRVGQACVSTRTSR